MTKEQVIEATANTRDLDYQIGVMVSFKGCRQIESRLRDSSLWFIDNNPTWNWAAVEYRIKPTATLRPWTADEVPLGAFMRPKQGNWRSLILAVDSAGKLIAMHATFSREAALEHYEHSTDGGKTWLPCGVVEELQ